MSMYETPQPSEKHIVCVWCVCVRACVFMCMCVLGQEETLQRGFRD